MPQLKLSYGKKARIKRRRQKYAATYYEKGSRHKDCGTQVQKEVGHTNDRKRGGRRVKWEAPVTPESLAAWLADEKAREIS